MTKELAGDAGSTTCPASDGRHIGSSRGERQLFIWEVAMKHAREDYQRRIQDSENLIDVEEPVFLIRSSDQIGPQAVRAWCHLHRANGGSDTAFTQAMKHADLMEQWGKTHGTKAADCPPDEKTHA